MTKQQLIMNPKQLYTRIWDAVCQIPRGRVTTYGSVAALCRLRGQQRLVGYALHNLPAGVDIPWHRVINANGMISLRGEPGRTQQQILESEGVVFLQKKIDLDRFGWKVSNMNRRGRSKRNNGHK
jgi:methylated-DNA-protein-cysteine methyltransferase-like protein